MTASRPEPTTLTATALRAELAAGTGTVPVDVRTPGEYESVAIDRAVNLPLDQLDAHLTRIGDGPGTRLVTVCQSGARATEAARKLAGAGVRDVAVLDGGMDGWLAAGAPVRRSARPRWALERQVRLAAGGIVAAAALGSARVPVLRFVAGGVGAGLVYAAASDSCAMGRVLMKLPYNRGSGADVERALERLAG